MLLTELTCTLLQMQTGKEQWQKHSQESANKIKQMKEVTKEIIDLREDMESLRQRLGKRPAAGELPTETASVPDGQAAAVDQLGASAQPMEPTPATSDSGLTQVTLDQSDAGAGAAATPQNQTNGTHTVPTDASSMEVQSAKAEGEGAPAESNGHAHPGEINDKLSETDTKLSEELLVCPPRFRWPPRLPSFGLIVILMGSSVVIPTLKIQLSWRHSWAIDGSRVC